MLQANSIALAPGNPLQEDIPDAGPPVPPGLCPGDVKEIEGRHPPEGAISLALLDSDLEH